MNTSTLVLRLARIEAQLVLEQGVARHKEIVSGRQAAQIMRAPLNIGFDLRGHALLLTLFSTWAPNWLWWLHTWPYWQYWALIWSCYDQNGSFDHLLFCREGSDHQNGWIFRFKYDQQWREEGWRRMTKGEERVDKCESAGGRPCSVTLFCHTKSYLCCNSSNCRLNTCLFLERFLWICSPLELLLRSEFIHIQKRQPWPTRVLKTEPPSECEHCDYHLNGGRG